MMTMEAPGRGGEAPKPVTKEEISIWSFRDLWLTRMKDVIFPVLTCRSCRCRAAVLRFFCPFSWHFCFLALKDESYIITKIQRCISIPQNAVPLRLWMFCCKRKPIGTRRKRFSTGAPSCKTWRPSTRTEGSGPGSPVWHLADGWLGVPRECIWPRNVNVPSHVKKS